MIILYRDLLYYIVFYILYYLYLGGFHASDSLSPNGSHPDMLFNLYFFSVICRINIFLLSSSSSSSIIQSLSGGWCLRNLVCVTIQTNHRQNNTKTRPGDQCHRHTATAHAQEVLRH